MERKEIRRVVAQLCDITKRSGDQELTAIFARVHLAILHNQVHLLYDYLRALGDMEQPAARGLYSEHHRDESEVTLERTLE